MSVLEDLRTIEQRVVARVSELRPLVDEYEELTRMAERLGLDLTSPTTAGGAPARRKRRATRPRVKPKRASGRSRPRGTRATGQERRERVLAIIEERGPVTVPDIGREIGVDAPQIYRLARKLQAEGIVKKEDRKLLLA